MFKLAEGLGLGMGGLKDVCGAVSGMFMAMSMFNSAGDKSDPRQTKLDTYAKIREFADIFTQECGSIYCRDLKSKESFTSCNRCVDFAAECIENFITTKE